MSRVGDRPARHDLATAGGAAPVATPARLRELTEGPDSGGQRLAAAGSGASGEKRRPAGAADNGGTATALAKAGIDMPTILGSLRRLLLAPALAEVGFGRRGFPVTPSPVTAALEAVPQAVVCGFEWGIDARSRWEVERRLAMVEPELRGFAYEGATMAFTVLDAMGVRRGGRTRELLLGPGAPHIFLTYIGIGFAMARLPRPLWKKIMPDLSGSPYYPTMTWLAVDGYGFDLAYFHTRTYVEQQRMPAPYPWQGAPGYFLRAVDQGIGRALWFIHGAQPQGVCAAVRRFAGHRQPDLWSGVGLAATFAGGCGADGLALLRREAGQHAPDLAQGSVFAAKARCHAGHVPAHTEVATTALAGLPVAAADALADSFTPAAAGSGGLPQYELWRRAVRARFAPAPVR
jgi:enediyne biosynthesis protein E2